MNAYKTLILKPSNIIFEFGEDSELWVRFDVNKFGLKRLILITPVIGINLRTGNIRYSGSGPNGDDHRTLTNVNGRWHFYWYVPLDCPYN